MSTEAQLARWVRRSLVRAVLTVVGIMLLALVFGIGIVVGKFLLGGS